MLTNKSQIAVTSGSFSKNPLLVQELRKTFENVRLNDLEQKFDSTSLSTFLKDVEGLIVGLETIDPEILKACPKLRVITKFGVGTDNIDFDACKNAGIKVSYEKGVNALSVAEETLGFMLSLMRNLYRSSLLLKTGNWQKRGGVQLSEKTVGIIGMGHVGKEVVRLLKPFRCRILVNDIIEQREFCSENNLVDVTKEEIFRQSDVLTLHVPLTPETKYLINERTLSSMKPTSYLINTSRGPVVNGADLKKALKSGKIAGAALDVYEEEPPSDLEFLQLPNLFCTPHIGGNAYEAVVAMGRSAIRGLEGAL